MGHKLGQVFIKDKNIFEKIIRYADIQPDNIVVEIGCGEGYLSAEMAKKCKKLYIIEIDPRCIELTVPKLPENVTIIEADILKTGFSEITEPRFRVIANIPYYISAPIVKVLIDYKDKLDSAILMVQDEFARKLLAAPGQKDYGSFSVYTRYFFHTDWLFPVSRTCFRPIPKVESAVIRMTPHENPPFECDIDLFSSIVRSAFWGRRKTLSNCVTNSPYLSHLGLKAATIPFFTKHPAVRGETLSILQFYELYQDIHAILQN